MFADYPPGYMYVLWLIGKFCNLLGISLFSVMGSVLVRLPAILADLAVALLLYRRAEKRLGQTCAYGLALLMAVNPVAILNSAVWGQVDSILALMLVGVFLLLEDEHPVWAAALYGAAVLVKPQALMAGPVFAIWYLKPFFHKGERLRGFNRLMLGLYAALGVIIIGALPFQGTQGPLWLVERYASTATSYPYGSVNGFNLLALLGGNWTGQEQLVFGLVSYKTLGMLGILISLGLLAWFAAASIRKGKFSLPLLCAFFLTGVFLLGHNMHERYMFPVLALLLAAFIRLRDRRLLHSFALFSGVCLINVGTVLYATISDCYHIIGEMAPIVAVFSLLSLACGGYFGWVCYDICVRSHVCEGPGERKWNLPFLRKPSGGLEQEREEEPKERETMAENPREERRVNRERDALERLAQPGRKARWSKIDTLCLGILTLVYAVVAFVNLGSTEAPQTYWRAGAGETLVVKFSGDVDIAAIWTYGGISNSQMEVLTVDAQGETSPVGTFDVDYDIMYRWNPNEISIQGNKLMLRAVGEVWLNEVAFKDGEGRLIIPSSVSKLEGGASINDARSEFSHVFDEQNYVPERPTAQNGMYFDELYHGRTAYEHLNGLAPYENSHPPLGKIFIMLGISLFGMNPFGWRFAGALFGVLMLPALYLLALEITKKTKYAFFATFLFAVDFMHFVQTRIATIDVFVVFFIILMYYFMYRYCEMNFFREKFSRTLLPLGLSGLCFGLGAASKWTGIYAGGGLAVIFFVTLYKRWREYDAARKALARGEEGARTAVEQTRNFTKYTLWTLLFCVGAFILVPVAIYLLSYLPYFLCRDKPYDMQGVWGVQEFMFNYHSTLQSTHPYESKWFTWLLDVRPIWYYMGTGLPEGTTASIAAFGNPVVWLGGLAGLLSLLFGRIAGFFRKDHSAAFLLIAFGTQFLPWVLISRATFIYHYFPSVPFIILALTYMIQKLEARYTGWRWLKWGIMGAALVLFALYYPVLSGTPVASGYIRALQILPTWTFMIG